MYLVSLMFRPFQLISFINFISYAKAVVLAIGTIVVTGWACVMLIVVVVRFGFGVIRFAVIGFAMV